MAPIGRRGGRKLDELELRHLRLLIRIRDRSIELEGIYTTAVEDFVLELRESGASARGIADVLGVGSSTVQAWTKNARQRRESSGP